jgi:hypothetical protein
MSPALSFLYIILNLALWIFPIVFFHITIRPYFEPRWRVIVGAICWSYLYGVVGAMLVKQQPPPLEEIALRVLVGLVYMGVGLACCEAVLWFYRANQRRSQAPTT